jgi:flagellar biogenesis protein FliO
MIRAPALLLLLLLGDAAARRPRRREEAPPPEPVEQPAPAAAPAGPLPEWELNLAESEQVGAPVEMPVETPVETSGGLSAPTAEDPQYRRLFGEGAAEVPPPPPSAAPQVPYWLPPVLLAAGGLAWWLRRRQAKGGALKDPIRLVGRSQVSPQAQLLLVDVDDGMGGLRRLVVGLGPGVPRLVSDLGPLGLEEEAPRYSMEHPRHRAPPEAPPVEEPRSRSAAPSRAEVQEEEAWDEAFKEAMSESSEGIGAPRAAPSPRLRRLPPGLEERDDLIAEVLAERGDVDRRGPARGGS